MGASPARIEPLEGRTLLAGTGLAGAYFARTNHTLTRFARMDATVDFDWSSGTPNARSLGTDGFSVRWTGAVQPLYSGAYTFITTTTGGVRLWVNHTLLLDNWLPHKTTENRGTITLSAGKRYDIRMDYWDDGSPTQAKLEWESAQQARQIIPAARLYGAVDRSAPTQPGDFRSTYLSDTALKLAWNPSGDGTGIAAYDVYMDGRKVVSTTSNTVSFARSGLSPKRQYSFSVQAIDDSGNHSTTASKTVTTAAPAVGGSGTGLAAQYYASSNFSAYKLTRTDGQINFTYGTDGSNPFGAGPISARWQGKILPKYSEWYTFYTVSQSGVRLWVNGQAVIDNWKQHPKTVNSAIVPVKKGAKYDLRLDYYSSDGNGAVQLLWQSFSQKKQVIPASQLFPAFVDTQAPTAPEGLNVTGLTSSSVSLAWSRSTDDVGVVKYEVYRDGTRIGATSGTSYTDSGLLAGTGYTYAVAAVDGVPHRSSRSDAVAAMTPTIPTIDAFSRISAGSYTSAQGVGRSGGDVNSTDDGDWIKFSRVDFGGGANSVLLELALPMSNVGGRIEMHLDSPDGPGIGTHWVQPTGSWSTYYTQRDGVSGASGMHDLYLVFRSGSNIGNIRSITFSTQRLTRVMALGDSITQGTQRSLTWRASLYNRLIGAGYGIDMVGSQIAPWDGEWSNLNFDQDNEGHANWRADELADNAANWAQAARPDVVLIHAGTNDLLQGDSASTVIDDLGRMIDALRSVNPSVKVLLAQLIPGQGIESKIAELNGLIPGLAAAKGATVVNQNSGFDASADTLDGIHPNDTGNQKMADRWYSALTGVL